MNKVIKDAIKEKYGRQDLTQVTSLELKHEHLERLGEELPDLTELVNLKLLSVGGADKYSRPIIKFSEELNLPTSLEQLYLFNLKLDSLPKWINKLKGLKGLSLWCDYIKSLPENLGELSNLEELIVKESHPVYNLSLPCNISKLSGLKKLEIGKCWIGSFPFSFEYLINLEKLDLSSNNLTELPQDIYYLKKLKKLNLQNNKLKELPYGITDLIALEELRLDNNELELLPATIGDLKNLRTINLDNNKLEELPDSFVQLCKQVYDNVKYSEVSLKDNNFRRVMTPQGEFWKISPSYLIKKNKRKFEPVENHPEDGVIYSPHRKK